HQHCGGRGRDRLRSDCRERSKAHCHDLAGGGANVAEARQRSGGGAGNPPPRRLYAGLVQGREVRVAASVLTARPTHRARPFPWLWTACALGACVVGALEWVNASNPAYAAGLLALAVL